MAKPRNAAENKAAKQAATAARKAASKQRRSQLWQAFQMQRKEDSRLLPYMIGAFVLIVALSIAAGILIGGGGFTTYTFIVLGIVLGALVAFAWVVRPPWPATLAWLLAWPLTQLSLILWPHIGYAVGLSGLLHAGAMVLACHLVLGRLPVPKARRWGALLALGVGTKVVLERGWAQPVVWDAGIDTSVVQAAHLAGVLWGVGLGLLTAAWPRPSGVRA